MSKQQIKNMNRDLQVLCNGVASRVKTKNDKFQIDPFTIVAIANLVIAVLKFLYVLYSKKKVVSSLVNRTWVLKAALKIMVLKSGIKFRDQKAVTNAILAHLSTMPERKIQKVVDSIL